ncbi:HNH endonuclease signature motif containing protein [Mycolicibacterium mengxianglii]|uniref:HNH endonuclease signature motif containing protein n=1 Tax=Mycolicibacterium mengxianglii TaxID=2736649 RepID=UPI0018D160CF|nr:HNH endonuclease signature motif containing protein [Mycolicibacterium mengxianglii]
MFSNRVSEAVAMLLTAMDALAAVSKTEWEGLPLADRLATAESVETARRRGLAVGTTLAATLVGDDQAVLGGGPRQLLADWLRITTAEAKHRLDHAAKVEERTTLTGPVLPPVLAATAASWHAGRLDEEHLTAILDFIKDLPADIDPAERDTAEAFLAHKAAELRPEQLKQLADNLAITLNPDGVFTDADRKRQSSFCWGPQRRDGMSKGTLWATPELRAGLDAHFAHAAKPGMNNPADQSPCTQGEPDPELAGSDTRSPAQRRHDALNALVRRQLGDPDLGTHRGLPVTIIVSTTLSELQSGAGQAVTAAGTLLPIPDLIRMAQHAFHYLTVFDDVTGRPLWLGRTKRCASADQRIILHALDRGCTFPGCDKPGYLCEVHHVDEWAAGGRTDIDNLTFACGVHHKLLSQGWRTRKLGNGDTEWLPPTQLGLTFGGTVNAFHHPERFLPKTVGAAAAPGADAEDDPD